jgi:hypothetical protein
MSLANLTLNAKSQNTLLGQLLYNAGPKTSLEIFNTAWNSGALDPKKKDLAYIVIRKAFNKVDGSNYQKLYTEVEKDLVVAGILTFPSPYSKQQAAPAAIVAKPEPIKVQQLPQVQNIPEDKFIAIMANIPLNEYKIYSELAKGKLLSEAGLKQNKTVVKLIKDNIQDLPVRRRGEGLNSEELLKLKEALMNNNYLKQ